MRIFAPSTSREHGGFDAFESFFDDDLFARVAELHFDHHAVDGVERLIEALGNDHALALGEPGGLNHRWVFTRA